MGRYDNISYRRNRKGQKTLVSVLYPKIDLSNDDVFIFPVDGERLDNVAFRYYKDASLWWVIAKANGLGKGRTVLNPNIRIRVPQNITKITSDFNKLNT